MTEVEKTAPARVRHSGFVIDSSFRVRDAFTLIELLVVIAIIIVLAGLVLSTVGYVQKKGARSRAETEIAAVSAACESYRADNGIYPRDPTANTATDALNARTMFDPVTTDATLYKAASLVLYRALSGDTNCDRTVNATDQNFKIDGTTLSPPLTQLPKSYFTFKPNQLSPTDQSLVPVEFIRDPFGNSYGYSTAYQYDPVTGYNPTFDLWSTSGTAPSPTPSPPTTQQDLWIKNW
jgi:prepilin-type N-terminal cleavage/methylation domain-containing protein